MARRSSRTGSRTGRRRPASSRRSTREQQGRERSTRRPARARQRRPSRSRSYSNRSYSSRRHGRRARSSGAASTGESAQQLTRGRAVTLVFLIAILAVVLTGIMVHEHRLSTLKNDQLAQQQKYDFNPGLIVSDQKFFDSSSMNETTVQAFLNEKGASCTGDLCLRSAAFKTESRAQDAQCNGYEGGGKQSAALIIDQSARSCRISQRTLLVMLEKEQGLVRTTDPTPRKYAAAMGLSCPDTGGCDARHAGFFRQVYGAAERLRYYQNHSDSYRYHSGQVNPIAYSPNPSCGTGQVYIENTATALLYIYTPYQPNQAALAGRFGDQCSSYGNLNFSRLWQQWFGPTR